MSLLKAMMRSKKNKRTVDVYKLQRAISGFIDDKTGGKVDASVKATLAAAQLIMDFVKVNYKF